MQTGWLSREAIPEYFGFFPRRIGILEDNFYLSEVGRTLLLGFISNDEFDALEGPVKSGLSPLDLTQSQKVFFIYSILKADGDFILPLLERLVEFYGNTTFTYLDAGKVIPPVLDKMAEHFRGSAYTTDDQREISEIERIRDLVIEQNRIKVEKRGTGSRREQISVPRLEWLVDLGILKKEKVRSYKFTRQGLLLTKELTSHYNGLFSQYYPEDCLGRLINQHLFGPIITFICGFSKKVELHEQLNLLMQAYEVVKGSLGYVLIRSLLLIINGWQAEKGIPSYVEYDDALRVIEAEYKRDPVSTYYTVDRLGDEHQVKFTP